MSVFAMMFETKQNMLKRSFNDVYGQNYNPTNYTAPEYTDKRIDTSSTNVYVHDCVFRNCIGSGNGGAVCCSSSVLRLLVEQSTFISCKASSSHGGGIFFENTASGECILSRICGFNCSSIAAGHGQLGYLFTSSSNSYKNHVNDSSVSHSSNVLPTSRNAFRLRYGIILCPSVNITNTECYRYTTLDCSPTSSATCCISYNTIVNNTACSYTCIWLSGPSSSFYIDTCNILYNEQTESNQGTIYANGNLLVKDSCILGNNEGKTVFYASSSYEITISNCTIDNDIFANGRYYGSVTVIKTIQSSFINALSHISTQRCDSYFDSYGTLTVKTNIPSQIPRLLLSCNCNCGFLVFSYSVLSLIFVILK